ncbi:MAG: hypothetical protein ACP5HK_05645 [Acidilobus sp.]
MDDPIIGRLSAAETALRSLGLGLVTSLNANFYAKYSTSFLECLIRDPVTTYNEAVKVAPPGLVEAAIKIALRALGFEPHHVNAFIEALRRGNREAAMNLMSPRDPPKGSL